MTYVLGITGGIASGKSTVIHYLESFHIPIVDGDVIARKIVEKGQPALEEIKTVFGADIVDKAGNLRRKELAAIIFGDKSKRKELDELLEPFLRQAIVTELMNHKQQAVPLVVVDLPLLFEAKYEHLMDGVAVVFVNQQQQRERLMKRDQLSFEAASQRINSQMPLEEKCLLADFIFDNSHSQYETEQQVAQWLEEHHFKKKSNG